jgi:hypothetical protein
MVGKPEVLRKETRLVPWGFLDSFDQLDAVSFSLFVMILSAAIQCGIEALHGIIAWSHSCSDSRVFCDQRLLRIIECSGAGL